MPKIPATKHMIVYGVLGVGAAGYGTWALANSTVGYPYQLWFVDMMDAKYVRAYEEPMRALPEGVVSRNMYVPNADRMTDEGKALTMPAEYDPANAEWMAQGEWSYATYCAPCHSANAQGMGPVTDNSSGKRFQVPPPALAGDAGVLSGRTDGYVYLTIRNGGAIMPSYGWAMNDSEMWSIVAWLRTQPNATYVPPEPAPEEGTEEG